MSGDKWEIQEVFDADYLYFYETVLTESRTTDEVNLIRSRIGCKPSGVLDVGCGQGRIANKLALNGYEVVGIDMSEVLLAKAVADAAHSGSLASFFLKDARDFTWPSQFDAVISWFTSIGYRDDAYDKEMFSRIFELLRPGGIFLIDVVNRDKLLMNFPSVVMTDRADRFLIDKNSYDWIEGRMKTERIIFSPPTFRRVRFNYRLYTFVELSAALRGAGFNVVEALNEFGERYSENADRLVIMAEKRGGWNATPE